LWYKIIHLKGLDLSALKSLVAQFQLIVNNVSTESRAVKNLSDDKTATRAVDLKDWWDDSDIKVNLHMSTSTIYRRRKDGSFPSFKIGGRHYYYGPQILEMKDRFMK
jgi:hypothetical protein